jgi:hypothetical protein
VVAERLSATAWTCNQNAQPSTAAQAVQRGALSMMDSLVGNRPIRGLVGRRAGLRHRRRRASFANRLIETGCLSVGLSYTAIFGLEMRLIILGIAMLRGVWYRALDVTKQARKRRIMQTVLMLLTDGRANVGLRADFKYLTSRCFMVYSCISVMRIHA